MTFGSGVPAMAVPESQTLPTAERQGTVMTAVSLAAYARLVHVQVTVGPATVHVPPDVATIASGDGPLNRFEVATSEMFWLSLGPLLVTVSGKVAVPLPALPPVVAVCDNARSASVCTVPHVCDQLLLPTGSTVVVEMLAVLQSWPPLGAEGLRRTTSVKDAAAPPVKVALVQLMGAGPAAPTAGLTQFQPAGAVNDLKVVPAAMVSVSATLWASLGPLLAALIVYVTSVRLLAQTARSSSRSRQPGR